MRRTLDAETRTIVYHYRDGPIDQPDNRALRAAYEQQAPLVYFHGLVYDRNLMGIDPEGVVHIDKRLLAEIDGPMLTNGLQGFHGAAILRPRRKVDHPDPSGWRSVTSAFSLLATCPGLTLGSETAAPGCGRGCFGVGWCPWGRATGMLSGGSDGERVVVVGQDRPAGPGLRAVMPLSLDRLSP